MHWHGQTRLCYTSSVPPPPPPPHTTHHTSHPSPHPPTHTNLPTTPHPSPLPLLHSPPQHHPTTNPNQTKPTQHNPTQPNHTHPHIHTALDVFIGSPHAWDAGLDCNQSMMEAKLAHSGPHPTLQMQKHCTPIVWSASERPRRDKLTVPMRKRDAASVDAVLHRLHSSITLEIWKRSAWQIRSSWPVAEMPAALVLTCGGALSARRSTVLWFCRASSCSPVLLVVVLAWLASRRLRWLGPWCPWPPLGQLVAPTLCFGSGLLPFSCPVLSRQLVLFSVLPRSRVLTFARLLRGSRDWHVRVVPAFTGDVLNVHTGTFLNGCTREVFSVPHRPRTPRPQPQPQPQRHTPQTTTHTTSHTTHTETETERETEKEDREREREEKMKDERQDKRRQDEREEKTEREEKMNLCFLLIF